MSDWSIIIWCNDKPLMQEYALSFVSGYGQLGAHNVELIPIYPDAGCKTMGHAYNIGQEAAQYENRIYMHQDVALQDWSVLNKLAALLDTSQVGAVGLIGSTTGSGGIYTGADESTWVGEKSTAEWVGNWPETCEVAVVDGLFFATRQHIDWPTTYFGPHMCVEDACMQVKIAGLKIVTLDTLFAHRGSTTMDQPFFESVKIFRRKYRKHIGSDIPTMKELQWKTGLALDIAKVALRTLEPEGTPFDDYVRLRLGNAIKRSERPKGIKKAGRQAAGKHN